MTISKEAVDAADKIWRTYPQRYTPTLAKDMLEAALPFLARPAPSQSDDVVVESILVGLPGIAYKSYIAGAIHNALAAVRAEATTLALAHFNGKCERDKELAAKDEQIAALREALGHIAIKRAWHELTTNECWEAYSDMRRIAHAALEMSGGVL